MLCKQNYTETKKNIDVLVMRTNFEMRTNDMGSNEYLKNQYDEYC